MKEFTNKVAVITGAGSGIGQGLALELAKAGARLALSDINREGLKETEALVKAESPAAEIRLYELDVSSRDAVYEHAKQVKQDFGAAHLLFNNAGVALFATIDNITMDEFDWLISINLFGVVNGTKAFLPIMREQDEGHIVNISSILGLFASPANGAYVTAKFAVRGFTETLARELEGSNIYASCVHPGGIKTKIGSTGKLGVNAGPFEAQCRDKISSLLKTEPRQLAVAILRGVRKRNRRILAGDSAFAADLVARLFPKSYGKIFKAVQGL